MHYSVTPNHVIDGALKSNCRILATLLFPAFLTGLYRNLHVEFLPFHAVLITAVYLGFVIASFNFITNGTVRIYLIAGLLLSLFILSGYRNDSFLNVDIWLIFAGCVMAFRASYLWILIALITAISLLLVLLRDSEVYTGVSFYLGLILHLSSLAFGFVIFGIIKTVLSSYHSIYEDLALSNVKLNEKNKGSYQMVIAAEKAKDETREKLMSTAFSLQSQIKTLGETCRRQQNNTNDELLLYIRSRLENLSDDIHDFIENGTFISDKTTELTLSEFAQIMENFSQKYSCVSDTDHEISSVSEELNNQVFCIPTNIMKVVFHHLIEHCSENHEDVKLAFEHRLGRKSNAMQEIITSLVIESNKDSQGDEFSILNNKTYKNRNTDFFDEHLTQIAVILRRLSGKIQSKQMNAGKSYQISYWVSEKATH